MGIGYFKGPGPLAYLPDNWTTVFVTDGLSYVFVTDGMIVYGGSYIYTFFISFKKFFDRLTSVQFRFLEVTIIVYN